MKKEGPIPGQQKFPCVFFGDGCGYVVTTGPSGIIFGYQVSADLFHHKMIGPPILVLPVEEE